MGVSVITDNGKRLEIVLQLKNMCDYEEFCVVCKGEGVTPLPLLEYAQKIGIVLVSKIMFPNDTPMDAYLRVVNTVSNKVTREFPEPNKPVLKPRPQTKCCGGGAVR